MIVKRFKLLTMLVHAFLCILFTHTVAGQGGFSRLVVFGDSLSDSGNLAAVNLPRPYFNNRISNGPVLADFLAQAIGGNADRSGHLLRRSGGFNYAVSGGNILGGDAEDLRSQISAFLLRTKNFADPNALYLVFMGGNDVRGLRSIESQVSAELKIADIVRQLDVQLERLVVNGARSFIVPNVANIGRLPETLVLEGQDPGVGDRVARYSRIYNRALTLMLSKYRKVPNLRLLEFDLYLEFERILETPSKFGFTTITEGCFDPSNFSVELECLVFGFDRRPFFDQLHPSSAANNLVAARLLEQFANFGTENDASEAISPILFLLLDE